jgi:hypothetical protein
MFKHASVSDEVASEMESHLIDNVRQQENKESEKRLEAAKYVHAASEALERAKLNKYAAEASALVHNVLEKDAKKRKCTPMEREVWAHFGNIGYADDAGAIPDDAGTTPLEEKFLDVILGEDEEENASETAQIADQNVADDIGNLDELFEDV